MNNLNIIKAVVLSIGLIGCVPTTVQEISKSRAPLIIKPTANSAYFNKKKDGTNRVAGMELRTFQTNNGKPAETVDAKCKVETTEFLINATTPAKISMPIMLEGADETMTITCKKGSLNGSRTFFLQSYKPGPTGNILSDAIIKGALKVQTSQVYITENDLNGFYLPINLQ